MKNVHFSRRILDFHIFSILFFAHGSTRCHLQCDFYDLNLKFFIFFSKKFTSSIVLEFWIKTLVNKKNSSLLILTNIELRFEQCILNLIWKWCAKDPQKREYHLIFMNFKVKKFTIKTTQKNDFDVWML